MNDADNAALKIMTLNDYAHAWDALQKELAGLVPVTSLSPQELAAREEEKRLILGDPTPRFDRAVWDIETNFSPRLGTMAR